MPKRRTPISTIMNILTPFNIENSKPVLACRTTLTFAILLLGRHGCSHRVVRYCSLNATHVSEGKKRCHFTDFSGCMIQPGH